MTCLSELTCAVYVDGELSPEETRDAERHLAGCARCRALVAALRDENRVLSAALGEPAGARAVARGRGEARVEPRALGCGARTSAGSARGGSRLAALVGAGSLARLAGWGELPGRPLGDWIGLAVESALFVVTNAATLERALTTLAVGTMLGLALAGGLYLGRTPSRAVATLALALGGARGLLPSSAEALETRSGREVTIGAGETLDATLVAAAENVRVDGTIDGDLIVAAAHVDVRGTVRGDLVVVARTRGSGRPGGGQRVCRRRVADHPRPSSAGGSTPPIARR